MQPSPLPTLLLLLSAAVVGADWAPDEDSSPAEGSGGHWEDDEDVLPLSPEEQLSDAARFRDELIWDAEREVERARAAPTPALQPLTGGEHGEAAARSLSSGVLTRAESDAQQEVDKAKEQAKAAVLARLVGGLAGPGGVRDDLYFQDGADLRGEHNYPGDGNEGDAENKDTDDRVDGDVSTDGGSASKIERHFGADNATMSTAAARSATTAAPVTTEEAARPAAHDGAHVLRNNTTTEREASTESPAKEQDVPRVLVQGVLVPAGDEREEYDLTSAPSTADDSKNGSRPALIDTQNNITIVNSSREPLREGKGAVVKDPVTLAETGIIITTNLTHVDSDEISAGGAVGMSETTTRPTMSSTVNVFEDSESNAAPAVGAGDAEHTGEQRTKSDGLGSPDSAVPAGTVTFNTAQETSAEENKALVPWKESALDSASVTNKFKVMANESEVPDSPESLVVTRNISLSLDQSVTNASGPTAGHEENTEHASSLSMPESENSVDVAIKRSNGTESAPATSPPPAVTEPHTARYTTDEQSSAATADPGTAGYPAEIAETTDETTLTPIAIPPTPPNASTDGLFLLHAPTSSIPASPAPEPLSLPRTGSTSPTATPSSPSTPPNATSSSNPSQHHLSAPVQAASVARRPSPAFSPCQQRCRSLLADLRLQVDPPRLLVASGAAVSVQCLLPSQPGALADLSWTFRSAGAGECALMLAAGGRPRCAGFGDTAQMYFVNQTMTSSRLAVPRVTAALGGHYTCTARVRCCPRSRGPPASRTLSTYIHVYGPRPNGSYWAVSTAVCVCLAAGLAAALALRRRCARCAKRPPAPRRHYQPVAVRRARFAGDGAEEDEEWARLYTGPFASPDHGRELASTPCAAAGQRQQSRHPADAVQTQETDLDAEGDDEAAEAKTARLGEAFAGLPETRIARTHAARPAHIRANPLASPQFRPASQQGSQQGSAIVSPRYEIPLTPPDAPPTPPRPPTVPLWRLGAAARQ